MEPVLDDFRAVAADVAPPCARRSRSTRRVRGRLLDVDEPMDADYWAEQIVATVRFADAVAAALESEPTHLIEVGPRRILAPLVRRIGAEQTPPVLVPCPGPDATGLELDEVVAALYRDGLDPEWDVLYEPAQRVRRRLGGYEFSTAAPLLGPVDIEQRRRAGDRRRAGRLAGRRRAALGAIDAARTGTRPRIS